MEVKANHISFFFPKPPTLLEAPLHTHTHTQNHDTLQHIAPNISKVSRDKVQQPPQYLLHALQR